MEKQIINITEIIEYLYCPRKVWLKKVKGIKEIPNKAMILGMIKHKVFDFFSKNEISLVSGIRQNIEENQIAEFYFNELNKIIQNTYAYHNNLMQKFDILPQLLTSEIHNFMEKEIRLRAKAIKSGLNAGFIGRELWFNLKPKYLTEFQLSSEELGLKGRIDRVEIAEKIIPYEIKTRAEIYPSDKIQLAGYALLLEKEFNKKIDKGIIETSQEKQEVEITEELKHQILDIAEKIRNIEKQEPEFGSNFNKCKACKFKKDCFE